jgi:hypothetical protein
VEPTVEPGNPALGSRADRLTSTVRNIPAVMPYADPELQRAANREHMRRRRASEPHAGSVAPLVAGELRLRKAADVLAVLDGQVTAVLADDKLTTPERARLIAALAGVSLRAIEASDLAARVEAVERVLAGREAAAK